MIEALEETASRISSCASHRAVASETIEDAMLRTKDFSALGRPSKLGSLDASFSETYDPICEVRHVWRIAA